MEAKDLNEARIYVGTYAKYNNGSFQGKWVELSDFYDLDGFMERCAEIYGNEEEPEYMLQDWENIPDSLIDESRLEENFFELRDELDRLNDTEKEAFWTWEEGNNIKLSQDAYDLVKSFQSVYVGSYASKEDFAEELVRMENDLSDFPLRYFYGESANAIKIQIWVTLLANLLLMVLKARLKRAWSFSGLATIVRICLIYYADVYTLLRASRERQGAFSEAEGWSSLWMLAPWIRGS